MEFRYPEASSHGGRLEYHGPIPVLHTSGTPEQVGTQIGELALKPAVRLLEYPYDYIRSMVGIPLLPRLIWFLIRRKCGQFYPTLPETERREIEAIAATGLDRSRLVAANTLFDMSNMGYRPLFGCSSFLVSANRSATGGVLFGRNLDFFDLGYLHAYSLAMVHRTAGKFGFVSLGFPGAVGCFSGMNEHGLSIARHEVVAPRKMQGFEIEGTSFAIVIRKALEECRTVAEAVAVFKATRHATLSIVGIADARDTAVLELSPAGTFVRDAVEGFNCFTNHYKHEAIRNPEQPNKDATLDREASLRERMDVPKADVKHVWDAIHSANAGELTLQSMVFEPAAKRIHAAFGKGPTTAIEPSILDVGELLKDLPATLRFSLAS